MGEDIDRLSKRHMVPRAQMKITPRKALDEIFTDSTLNNFSDNIFTVLRYGNTDQLKVLEYLQLQPMLSNLDFRHQKQILQSAFLRNYSVTALGRERIISVQKIIKNTYSSEVLQRFNEKALAADFYEMALHTTGAARKFCLRELGNTQSSKYMYIALKKIPEAAEFDFLDKIINLKDPAYNLKCALEVNGAPIGRHRKVIIDSNSIGLNLEAVRVLGGTEEDIKRHQAAVCKIRKFCKDSDAFNFALANYLFPLFTQNYNLDNSRHQNNVCRYGTNALRYAYAANVKDADTETIRGFLDMWTDCGLYFCYATDIKNIDLDDHIANLKEFEEYPDILVDSLFRNKLKYQNALQSNNLDAREFKVPNNSKSEEIFDRNYILTHLPSVELEKFKNGEPMDSEVERIMRKYSGIDASLDVTVQDAVESSDAEIARVGGIEQSAEM